MKRSSATTRPAAAFTLIELLTVIAIIGILMAMLFPFIQGAIENARKRKAMNDCLAIVQAVESYNSEYGAYPKIDPSAAPAASGVPDDACGDNAAGISNRNSALFNTLRNIDRTPNEQFVQNPRRQVFMSGNSVSNTAKPKEGFLEVAGTAGNQGSMYDPWGSEYNIVIDSNSDNVITVDYYDDYKGDNAPHVSVGAFSLGKDKKIGKNGDGKYKDGTDVSDDLISWAGH